MRRSLHEARWILLILATIVGCDVSAEGVNDPDRAEGTRAMMRASEVDSIARAVRSRFTEAFALGGTDTTLASFYTPDAIFSDHTGQTHDVTQIRAAYGAMPPGSQIELRSFGVVGSGDLIVDIGTSIVSFDTPEGPVRVPGRYMIAYQRMSDGTWRIVRKLTTVEPDDGPASAPADSSATAAR